MESDPKQQLGEVRTLIKVKQFDEARKRLKTIDHPQATKWLRQIDDLAPKQVQSNNNRWYAMIAGTGAVALIVGLLFGAILFRGSSEVQAIQLTVEPLPTYTLAPIVDSARSCTPEEAGIALGVFAEVDYLESYQKIHESLQDTEVSSESIGAHVWFFINLRDLYRNANLWTLEEFPDCKEAQE